MSLAETLARRVQELEAKNAYLREEVSQLKSTLTKSENDVPRHWNLTPSQRRLFACLMRFRVAPRDALMTALENNRMHEPEDPDKVLRIHICLMRKKLKPFGIEIKSVHSFGYEMTGEISQ